jgi:hypothetical protein
MFNLSSKRLKAILISGLILSCLPSAVIAADAASPTLAHSTTGFLCIWRATASAQNTSHICYGGWW